MILKKNQNKIYITIKKTRTKYDKQKILIKKIIREKKITIKNKDQS